MEDNLLKILKGLKQIKPDSEYTQKSRALLLAVPKEVRPISFLGFLKNIKNIRSPRLIMATEIMGVVLVVSLISGYYVHHQGNQERLVVQADELNSSINVTLNQIRYLLLLNRTPIESADLTNFVDSLVKAEKDLEVADQEIKDNNIEESVQKIMAAQETILNIEKKLEEVSGRSTTATK